MCSCDRNGPGRIPPDVGRICPTHRRLDTPTRTSGQENLPLSDWCYVRSRLTLNSRPTMSPLLRRSGNLVVKLDVPLGEIGT